MNFDQIQMIPSLSGELKLIGLNVLPYTITKNIEASSCGRTGIGSQTEEDFSDEESSTSTINMSVNFDKMEMMNALVESCCNLVKQIKTFDLFEGQETYDVIKFDNCKLQKQIKSLQGELTLKEKQVAQIQYEAQELRHQCIFLKSQLKSSNDKYRRLMARKVADEEQLHSLLRKKDSEMHRLHSVLQRKFQLIDIDYAAEHLHILSGVDVDFTTLWEDCRSLNSSERETAMRTALCRFQEINNELTEKNILLRSIILRIMDKIHDFNSEINRKMPTTSKSIDKIQIKRIIITSDFESATFKEYIAQVLQNLKSFIVLFDISLQKTFD